jgi:hypothetical protein
MHAAHQLGRNFIGVDIAYAQGAVAFDPVVNVWNGTREAVEEASR